MMWSKSKQSSNNIDHDVYEVFLRMNSGEINDSDNEYFEDWRDKNPELLGKYQELESLWNELGIYTTDMHPDCINRFVEQPRYRLMHYFTTSKLAVAASFLLIVSFFGVSLFYQNEKVLHYQTERGERMIVSLEDGSNIHLNSLSDVHVRYDERQRTVILNKGEALFDVAHDQKRKFMVNTIHGSIQAVGTEFNVSVVPDDIKITIIEGTVLIKSKGNSDNSTIGEVATVGEQVLVDSNGLIESTTIENTEQVIAWTRGKLVFSGEPLYLAVEKVNLHSKHNITIKDSRLRNLPLFGVFNTGDTLGFISAIQEAFPVQALEISGNATLLIYRTDS